MRPPPAIAARGNSGFNSRTPGGVRRLQGNHRATAQRFQFTHPGRGATEVFGLPRSSFTRFNSRTPGGVRPTTKSLDDAILRFNSRTPGGVRQLPVRQVRSALKVSIHAPREGCDERAKKYGDCYPYVSIHAPREGCDDNSQTDKSPMWRFNSRTPGGVRPQMATLA